MSKKQKTKERLNFDYNLYRKVAQGIHSAFCEDRQWCNYDDPIPVDMEDDPNLPIEYRENRTLKRIEWMRHCDVAVAAENIAARIQFGKGAKVRKFPNTKAWEYDEGGIQGSEGGDAATR